MELKKISEEDLYCFGKIFLRFTPEFANKSEKEKTEYLSEIASKIRGFLLKEMQTKGNISTFTVYIPEDKEPLPWNIMTDTSGKISK